MIEKSESTESRGRPNVALINNSQTPYRQALHVRVVRETPEVCFFSVFTHEVSNSAWAFRATTEINPVEFGRGECALEATQLKSMYTEWAKGGRIIQWMKKKNIRAVILGGYNDAGKLRIIRFCCRHEIPCFLFGDSNIKGDCTAGLKGMLKRLLLPRIVRLCSGVMPCGELGRQYFLRYGADPAHIYFFPYEPDYELIRSIDDGFCSEVRIRFNFGESRRRIVYSGRLVDVKRVDLLIDAFLAISAIRPDWDLVIVGAGPLQAELNSRVPSSMEKRVKWLGFLDDQRTLSAIYKLSDVLVLPSDYEPWGVVINEAVAAGMAILASDQVGAAHDLVLEGKNGFTFRAGNIHDLMDRLKVITETSKLTEFKKNSTEALRKWKEKADPVIGLRAALVDFKVIGDK